MKAKILKAVEMDSVSMNMEQAAGGNNRGPNRSDSEEE